MTHLLRFAGRAFVLCALLAFSERGLVREHQRIFLYGLRAFILGALVAVALEEVMP
jgi:hypothetical protein